MRRDPSVGSTAAVERSAEARSVASVATTVRIGTAVGVLGQGPVEPDVTAEHGYRGSVSGTRRLHRLGQVRVLGGHDGGGDRGGAVEQECHAAPVRSGDQHRLGKGEHQQGNGDQADDHRHPLLAHRDDPVAAPGHRPHQQGGGDEQQQRPRVG